MNKNQQFQELNKRLKIKFKAQKLLFGQGSLEADIMIVGDFPSTEEILKNRPFLGTAGRAFNKMIKDAGLVRNKIYITHAVKSAKNARELPGPKEVKQFSHFLREEIKLIEPKLIIALGHFALRGLNVKLPLMNIRGKLLRFGANNLFSTHHPSVVAANPALTAEMETDFKKLQEGIKTLV